MARVIWRKQNLKTVRMAMLVQGRLSRVVDEMVEGKFPGQPKITTHPESKKMIEAAKERVCEELGDVHALLEVGEAASFDSLSKALDFEERLGVMVDRYLKRFLFVRGLKSMPAAAIPERVHRISGPSAEA